MADATKYELVPNNNIVTDFRTHFSFFRNRRSSSAFVYGVVFVFIAFSVFLAFSPSSSTSSPSTWFINIFTLNNTSPPYYFDDFNTRSPVPSDLSSNSTQIHDNDGIRSHKNNDTFQTPMSDNSQNLIQSQLPPDKFESDDTKVITPEKPTNQSSEISTEIPPISSSKDSEKPSNQSSEISTQIPPISSSKDSEKPSNQSSEISTQISPISSSRDSSFESKKPSSQSSEISTQISPQISPISPNKDSNFESNENDTKFGSTQEQQQQHRSNQSMPEITPKVSPPNKGENFNPNNATNYPQKQSNQTSVITPQISPTPENSTKLASGQEQKGVKMNDEVSESAPKNMGHLNGSVPIAGVTKKKGMVDSLVGCDLYDGSWVEDDSYPLYKPGSCKLVDEQFNCILNGRPDTNYQKLRWKPKGCTLPRLKGKQILKLLKGKRLVFVGDSLNRNMWESLVCILKGAAKNPKNVFEAYGRHSFRTEASYSFVFKDYNFTIEFFVAPFLVQQWDFKDKNGATKETLRLDLMVRDSDHFKYADVVVFNTGHWWTHEKTSKGEDYYQEGSHVYQQLDVKEAFRKAITTWGRWIDANIDPKKTHVFFRGYSSTHFSGGQWNSGGQCDSETEPIRNESYLTKYPWKMKTLEQVLMGMKTPVSYLNITKLTDYRKDAHPSVYRKQRPSTQEKRTPLRFQDCSHWCLPGVPDSWNELLFAEMLRKHFLDNQTN